MYCQVDTDLLGLLSSAVTVPFYTVWTPDSGLAATWNPASRQLELKGLKQKILMLLPKSSSCCVQLGLGKALGGWMKEQHATPHKQQWSPRQAGIFGLPGFPLAANLDLRHPGERQTVSSHRGYKHLSSTPNASILPLGHRQVAQLVIDRMLYWEITIPQVWLPE